MPAATGPVWLVTGASRGIGLQLVTELLTGDAAKAAAVIAAARNPDKAAGLQELKSKHGDRLHTLQLDTADSKSIQAAAQWVREHVGHLDVLINNAGIGEQQLNPWDQTDVEEATRILATNVTGPLLLTAALLPLLKVSTGQRKLVGHISSTMGSVTRTAEDGRGTIDSWVAHYASTGTGSSEGAPPRATGLATAGTIYRASKAALNVEMLIQARDLAADNIPVVALHPGWVATDMGNASAAKLGMTAPVTPEQSARGLLHVLEGVSLKDTGSFLTWEGKTLPW